MSGEVEKLAKKNLNSEIYVDYCKSKPNLEQVVFLGFVVLI